MDSKKQGARVERVTIRGTSSGLRVVLGAGDWNLLLRELEGKLHSTPKFFRGGRVALVVGPRRLSQEDLQAVGELLEEHGVSLWAVESDNPNTKESTHALGLETPADPRAEAAPVEAQAEKSGQVVRRTLRSGQAVRYDGHVVIIGDVNPGAEIVASGDVVVWGRLRGTVHAGAGGDEKAVVCALQLAPMQLRIGNLIARSPEEEVANDSPLPEMASIQDGKIVAEPWSGHSL